MWVKGTAFAEMRATGLDPVSAEGSQIMGGLGPSEVTPHHLPHLTPAWVWLQAGNGAC